MRVFPFTGLGARLLVIVGSNSMILIKKVLHGLIQCMLLLAGIEADTRISISDSRSHWHDLFV